MNHPLISVIIPTYNGAKNIKRAITSALNQTYPNIEVIVVDDASTDNNVEIIESIKDKKLKLLKHKVNKNGSAARNTAIRASKGEYLALLDDDDEWLPEKLSKQLEYLNTKNSKEWKGVVCGRLRETNGQIKRKFTPKEGDLSKDILMMEVAMSIGSTFLFHKDVINEIGLFDEKYLRHQDLEFMLRYLRKFKLASLKDCLIRKYVISGNPSGEKLLGVKQFFLSDFKEDIEKFGRKTANQIYARQWLQVSKHFALDGDFKNTIKYYFKSLSFAFLFSKNIRFLPIENYLTIPYSLLRGLLLGTKTKGR